MTRIYIAGPMTGLPELNYPAFNAVAKQLSGMGFIALNPAENKGPAWADFMRQAIRQLSQADAVFFLPGWQQSKGAQLEMTIAKALELPIIHLPERAEAAKPLDPRAAQQEKLVPSSVQIIMEEAAKKQAEAVAQSQKAYQSAKDATNEKLRLHDYRLAAADHPSQGTEIPKHKSIADANRWQIEIFNDDCSWSTLGVTYSSEMVSPLLKMLKNLYPRQDLYVKAYVD